MTSTVKLAVCVGLLVCAGCGTPGLPLGADPDDFVKPTIAVMKFEDRAGGARGMKAGDGMKDVMVDRLLATKRFAVIERPEIESILGELRLQSSGVTRAQRRAALGRIKNVQYLLKGTITDFGHVSSGSSFFGSGGLRLFGGGDRAVMGLTMYVVEVESGQIVCSKSIEESVRAKEGSAEAAYKGVTFGGSSFYQTPLGRAARKVIGKAVGEVCGSIAARKWQPRIALVQPPSAVVINGGKDRGVKRGAVYGVFAEGEPIIDPETGDEIGVHPGPLRGHVRVTQVQPRYSVAEVVQGKCEDLAVGQHCRPLSAIARDAAPNP
ncbi:MAG TPA: CsgG/HfaB family protein [Phycisphaerae bacterium]|nr:CsgG/HfaB family protein [Phycisphaerae bacterium]